MTKKQEEITVKKKLTTNQKIMIGGFSAVTVVLVVASIIIFMVLNKKEVLEPVGNYVINESNYEEITGEMYDRLEAGMYEVTMNAVWSFTNGESVSSDAYIANATSNHNPVYFEVFLKDTNELVYTSSVLPVGTKLKELKLDKPLEKGTYDAICKYNLLDEGGEVASSVSISVTLNIAE